MVHIGFNTEDAIKKELEKLASKDSRTLSGFLNKILKEYLDENKAPLKEVEFKGNLQKKKYTTGGLLIK